jgi:trimethylamine-N-oxide reductase (cytochrome c)
VDAQGQRDRQRRADLDDCPRQLQQQLQRVPPSARRSALRRQHLAGLFGGMVGFTSMDDGHARVVLKYLQTHSSDFSKRRMQAPVRPIPPCRPRVLDQELNTMNYSRRGFLKAMAMLSGSALVAPGLLTSRALRKPARLPRSPTTSRPGSSGSHFGAIRAKVVGDRVVEVRPFEFDKHPTEMIKGIPGLIYSASRVRYPMVRLDWYKQAPSQRHHASAATTASCASSWDEALDLFYEELERVQKDHGPWALHTAGVGWRSVGQMHSCGNHMVRAVAMHGRSVGTIGDYSTGAGQVILPYVLGSTEVYSQGTSWEIILEQSKLIVFWANDPLKNLQVGWNTETHEAFAYFAQLKAKVAERRH